MKTFMVTVDKLMVDDMPYHTEQFQIMAHSPEEAQAIVFNYLELHYEPHFRITHVEETQ